MNMENILVNVIVIVAILVIVAVLYFAAKGKYRKVAKRILLSFVVAAEEKFGGGTGEVKFAYVADKLHERMPVVVQFLFTEKDVANMIEEAVDKMKQLLADNPDSSPSITEKEGS